MTEHELEADLSDDQSSSGSLVERGDWLLKNLVTIVNQSGMEFGITLDTGGIIVSGLAIPARKYCEQMASMLDDASGGEALASFFRGTAEAIYPPVEPDLNLDLDLRVGFIHLENARYFSTSGAPVPGDSGMLWRGQIESIAGFSFGSLSNTGGT